jgi:GNAT superfamily N-acetyltransferase
VIRLEPMSAAELAAYLARSIPAYAASHVRTGEWSEAGSLERSRTEHERLLPDGVATADHCLRTIVDATNGRRVGEVWYHVRRDGDRPQVWIYWIGIDPEFRRRGYAEATFHVVEDEARRLGAVRIALHVFGDNPGARALYSKLGYVATNVVMAKTLGPP